jgi:hypothetical protein
VRDDVIDLFLKKTTVVRYFILGWVKTRVHDCCQARRAVRIVIDQEAGGRREVGVGGWRCGEDPLKIKCGVCAQEWDPPCGGGNCLMRCISIDFIGRASRGF